jgi:hypothetical protein
VNNNEIPHICAGRRHNKTLKTVEQHRIGEKGEEMQWTGVRST